jgi:drug/metabolite transporter (DMT)-like permease
MNTSSASQAISLRSWVLIFAIPGFWSVNYLVGRSAPGVIAPHALALCRWALAACLLGVFAWAELKAKRQLIWHDRWHFLCLGALGMWICGAWLYLGARSASATNIALIYALSPVFIVLGAAYFLGEHLRRRQWFGVVLALLGLVHVVIQGRWGSLSQTRFVAGDWWTLGCALAWAMYSIFLKKWPSPFSPLARLVLIALGGVLLMLPLALIEAWSDLPFSHTNWGWHSMGLIGASALIPGAGAYWAYGALQKQVGAARTALVLYLGPVYAALLAWGVLNEPLHIYHAVGAAIILPGIYLASRARPVN